MSGTRLCLHQYFAHGSRGGTDPAQTGRHGALRWLLVAALLPLAACAGEFTTQSEALRLLAEHLPDALLDEAYSAPIEAVGGLRPYEFALQAGALPPGVKLQGGSLSGTPTTTGSFEFTIAVSDANLSSTFEQYTLRVVTPPPPSLTLQPPATESRGAVTLRARVDAARSLVGLRTRVTWDPTIFSLQEGSVTATRQNMALLHEAGTGVLSVDLAMLNGPLTGGAQLFTFVLTPLEPPALVGVSSVTEFASRRSGVLLFDQQASAEGPGEVTHGAGEPVDDPRATPPGTAGAGQEEAP